MGIIAIAIFGLMVFLVSTAGTVTALVLEWREADEADARRDGPLATVTELHTATERRSS